MNNKKLIIGSHVQVSGEGMLVKAVEDTISYGANTFMFYTGAPQNSQRKPISSFRIEEAKKLMKNNGIDIDNVIVHAPYIINLANKNSPDNFASKFLIQEIDRVSKIGCRYLVLHPGSHVGAGVEEGLKTIVKNLNFVFENDNSNVIILIETMAGKGTELGKNFGEIKYILDNVEKKDRLGVCIDSCHLNDAGYDVSNFDSVLDEFDKIVGVDKIKAVHINDSKNVKGAAKDRHENFGFGELGFETLIKIVYNPRLIDAPKILETPWVEDLPPYKLEIEMIRNKKFNENMKKELLNLQGK
ncbi:MAG: deoxyribonuclease IV [Bacilli bacterium]|nr:deoxyribonuclease IV [Bacilli bacterium]